MSGDAIFTLPEWSLRHLSGRGLSEEDRRRVDELNARSSRRLNVEEVRDGVRVRSFAHVGVLRFDDFSLRVEPKLTGGRRMLAKLVDYAAGLDELHRYPDLWESLPDGAHLTELFALFFVRSCEDLLRRGLVSDYVAFEDPLTAVRGRIQPRKQVIDRYGRPDKVHCRYDERVEDVWENRLLGAALDAARRLVEHRALRGRLRRAYRAFEQRCRPDRLDLPTVRRHRDYHRMNEHYREAHQLAILLLDALGLDDVYQTGSAPLRSFLLDMNALFERFLERLYADTFPDRDVTVRTQHRAPEAVYNRETGDSYTTLRPDLLLCDRGATGTRLPVDAKYKRYDTRRVSTADLYQLSTYAQTLSSPDDPATPRAALVYPAPEAERQQIAIRGAEGTDLSHVDLRGIPMERILQAVDGGVRSTDRAELAELLPAP